LNNEILLVVVLLVLNIALALWAVLRRSDGAATVAAAQAQSELVQLLQANAERLDRLERELRREFSESARDGRQESAQNLATFQQTLTQQAAEATRTQNTQIDAFGLQLAGLQKSLSDTLSTQLTALSESNARRIAELGETSARTLTEVRQTLDAQLAQLQATNATKLDEMRATVDEKLQSTLQARLGVPVIDGVAVAVKLIESLAALGLRTSKVGDYARPLDKEYIGWAAPLAWKRD
jgi:DNA recombination protein RmuC